MDAPEENQRPFGTMWLLHLKGSGAAVAPRIDARFQRVGPEGVMLAEAMGLAEAAPVLERFDGGARCYAGFVRDALANYGWVSFGEEWISELATHIRLGPDEAYIWDCATLPAFRGQGLYPALLGHISRELRDEGLRRVWIGTDYGSLDSQKGIVRAGFQPIADFYSVAACADSPAAERFQVRGRPGVPDDLVRDARVALLSD